MVDLPEPAVPTRAIVSPGATVRVNPDRTGSEARYPKVTLANSSAGAESGARVRASGASWTVGRESMTSNTRTTDALACCPMVSRLASMRTGPTSWAR